jgi:hypothetical protein
MAEKVKYPAFSTYFVERPYLQLGDSGAVGGDYDFWARFAALHPSAIFLRHAGQATIREFVRWDKQLRETEPAPTTLVYFPAERMPGFHLYTEQTKFAAFAHSPTAASIIRHHSELVREYEPRITWEMVGGAIALKHEGVA